MVISLTKIFILFGFFQSCIFHEFLEPNNSSNQTEPQDERLNNVTYLVEIFPIVSLAYIIQGFLPNIPNSPLNKSLVEMLLETNCFNYYLTEYDKGDKISLFNTIRYSGKSYPDFGDEEGCIEHKNAFLLICIKFDIKSLAFVYKTKIFVLKD